MGTAHHLSGEACQARDLTRVTKARARPSTPRRTHSHWPRRAGRAKRCVEVRLRAQAQSHPQSRYRRAAESAGPFWPARVHATAVPLRVVPGHGRAAGNRHQERCILGRHGGHCALRSVPSLRSAPPSSSVSVAVAAAAVAPSADASTTRGHSLPGARFEATRRSTRCELSGARCVLQGSVVGGALLRLRCVRHAALDFFSTTVISSREYPGSSTKWSTRVLPV